MVGDEYDPSNFYGDYPVLLLVRQDTVPILDDPNEDIDLSSAIFLWLLRWR
jgi:hypothetical protein